MVIEGPVLVDTGPLVAWMNAKDNDHHHCVRVFDALPLGSLFTCWPVLTEAAYLTRVRGGAANPIELLKAVLLHEVNLLSLYLQDIEPIQDVFTKYHDQQVDLADAAILQLAEREGISTIFTTDRRHFRVYRRQDGTPFRLLPDDFE